MHIPLAVVLFSPAALALSDVANQRVTKQAPPQSGCVLPPAESTFVPSDGTVYLYFEATESNSDYVTNDWVAPDGTVLNGGSWSSSSGRYCFTGAALGISNTPTNRFGQWQARVLNGGSVVFSVPFTINNPANPSGGAPNITDANPKSIPVGADTTITLTGTGFQPGFSAKLWVGSTPWPINSGSQALYDSPTQVRLVVRVGQPNDPATSFGLQVINPDGQPSNTYTGLTAMQSSTGGGGSAPAFRLPLPAGKDWLLSVETGTATSTSDCKSGMGGRYYGGGYDCLHSGKSKYSLDFLDNNRQDGELTGRGDVSILAAADGTVSEVVINPGKNEGCNCFGNYVVIDHGNGFTSWYGHLKDGSIPSGLVRGQPIHAGQQVGVMGTSGDSTGIHIHFMVRYNGEGDAASSVLDQVMVEGRRMIDYRVGNSSQPIYYPSSNGNPITGGGGAYPESAHPYTNNFDNTWTYVMSGNPAAIAVTFDLQTQVEQNYDYIYIMDGNGNSVAGSPFTGTALAGRTITVPGSTVKIRLTSDFSVTYFGFRVTNVAATSGGGNGGNGGLYQPGDGASDPNPWVQAFYRNQFNTYSVLPTDNPVSPSGPGCIQYFKATDTQQKTEVLMQRNCTGTVYQIYGGMWNKYISDGRLGGPTGAIGYPTNDRQNGRSSIDGQAFEWQEFQTTGGANTRIVQYNGTAYAVFAGILSYWASQGYENSKIGIPTSEEFDWGSNGCKRQNFQNGWYVWWTPTPGASCNGN
ncbi:MAG TPA: peptidoglycan DD-metalloendopeptidase family protein [Bryobacteraceae bacterium]|nr:peptidoglycan DD-metalloendopeptidase family protein [Bryobacteraceae bacterium]